MSYIGRLSCKYLFYIENLLKTFFDKILQIKTETFSEFYPSCKTVNASLLVLRIIWCHEEVPHWRSPYRSSIYINVLKYPLAWKSYFKVFYIGNKSLQALNLWNDSLNVIYFNVKGFPHGILVFHQTNLKILFVDF